MTADKLLERPHPASINHTQKTRRQHPDTRPSNFGLLGFTDGAVNLLGSYPYPVADLGRF
jgi:hypothetical protein